MPTVAQVRAALKATLTGIDSGESTYSTLDLTGTGAVNDGEPPRTTGTSTTGVAYLWRDKGTHSRGGEADLGAREGRVDWHVAIYGTPAARTGTAREAWLDGAEEDLLVALEASLDSGGDLAELAAFLDVETLEVTPLYGTQTNAPEPVGIWAHFSTIHIRGI